MFSLILHALWYKWYFKNRFTRSFSPLQIFNWIQTPCHLGGANCCIRQYIYIFQKLTSYFCLKLQKFLVKIFVFAYYMIVNPSFRRLGREKWGEGGRIMVRNWSKYCTPCFSWKANPLIVVGRHNFNVVKRKLFDILFRHYKNFLGMIFTV